MLVNASDTLLTAGPNGEVSSATCAGQIPLEGGSGIAVGSWGVRDPGRITRKLERIALCPAPRCEGRQPALKCIEVAYFAIRKDSKKVLRIVAYPSRHRHSPFPCTWESLNHKKRYRQSATTVPPRPIVHLGRLRGHYGKVSGVFS